MQKSITLILLHFNRQTSGKSASLPKNGIDRVVNEWVALNAYWCLFSWCYIFLVRISVYIKFILASCIALHAESINLYQIY